MKDLLATSAYRIVQEALTNVARHASVSHAEVPLALEGDDLVLQAPASPVGLSENFLQKNPILMES